MEKHEEYYDDEIDLMEYLEVIWKKKWLIIIPTFVLVVLVGAVSFTLPEIWEVETIILPAKFTIQTAQGSFEEVVVVPAKQISSKIKEGAYNQLIASELNLDMRGFPELKTETLRDTDLIQILSKGQDAAELKSVHLALFRHIKRETDKNVDIEMKNIESQIKTQQINKSKLEDEIKVLESKLNIIAKRKEQIEQSLVETRKRVEVLEDEQNMNLKKQNWKEGEALGMLLYSNEIQQSLQYLNNLEESLSDKKMEEENIKKRIEELQSDIEQINNEINNLNEKKGRIDFTQLAKDPTSSLNPVAPKKKRNVILAGLIGIFIFTILAFFIDYIQKHKLENKGK